jgi:adenylate kinase
MIQGSPTAGPVLVIVCGLPGSGKTTLAKEIEEKQQATRFSPDDWMDALELKLQRIGSFYLFIEILAVL